MYQIKRKSSIRFTIRKRKLLLFS